MRPLSFRTQIIVFLALALPAALSLWQMAVPGLMSASTCAALSLLVIGVAAVTINTARNAAPTGSLGQLLYETEHPARTPRPGRTTNDRP